MQTRRRAERWDKRLKKSGGELTSGWMLRINGNDRMRHPRFWR